MAENNNVKTVDEEERKRAVDLLFSAPFKCPPSGSYVIDPKFFDYLEDRVIEHFSKADYKLYTSVFHCTYGLAYSGVEKVTEWINLLWPHWLAYCGRNNLNPGVYPVATVPDTTPVEEIVF